MISLLTSLREVQRKIDMMFLVEHVNEIIYLHKKRDYVILNLKVKNYFKKNDTNILHS